MIWLGLNIASRYLFIFSYFSVFLKYLFIFRQRGREGERKGNINVWLPLPRPLLGTWPTTQACALDWELNWRPFGLQASSQSIEPHQPGLYFLISLELENFPTKNLGFFGSNY